MSRALLLAWILIGLGWLGVWWGVSEGGISSCFAGAIVIFALERDR